MSSSHRNEIQVGLFVLLGAILVAGLVLRFSKGGIAKGEGYPLIVEVKDATGIRAGAPVRLGGVDIGRVSGDPSLNKDFVMLSVPLEIVSDKRIPVGSSAKVATSGLMGDSYVRIVPPEKPTGEFLPEGHRLLAEPAESLTDLAGEAGEALDGMTDASAGIRSAAERVERLTQRLDSELLSRENLDNLKVLLTEMRTASANLRAASEQVPALLHDSTVAIEKIGSAADAASESFSGVDGSVEKFNHTLDLVDPTFAELDATLDDLRATLSRTQSLLKEMEEGDGLAAAFLKDPGLKQDLEGVLDKLNRYGILFYPKEGSSNRIGAPPAPQTGEEERKTFPGLRRQP